MADSADYKRIDEFVTDVNGGVDMCLLVIGEKTEGDFYYADPFSVQENWRSDLKEM
jgi:hypothetical protein